MLDRWVDDMSALWADDYMERQKVSLPVTTMVGEALDSIMRWGGLLRLMGRESAVDEHEHIHQLV